MTTYVVGHGELEGSRPDTSIPQGGSVVFFTDVGMDLLQVNGMYAVQSGDAGQGFRYNSPDPVPNYLLTPLSNDELVRIQTVEKEGLTVLYVGDTQIPADSSGVHLCEGDDTMCGEGRHICGGALGRVDDAEIVFVCCRGLTGTEPRYPMEFGSTGSTAPYEMFLELARPYETMSETERGKALCALEDAKNPDDQELLAYLMTRTSFAKAALKHRTLESVTAKDGETVRAMFKSQTPEGQGWMREVPGASELIDQKKPSIFAKKD